MNPSIKRLGVFGVTFFVACIVGLISLVPSADAAVEDSTNPGCDPVFADILRLYESYLGRSPDNGGANYWLNEYATGARDLANIKANFYYSPEFQGLYGNTTNSQFVTAVYQNVLDRNPDTGGFNYWLDRLNNHGLTRARFIEFIADSPEFRAAHPYNTSAFCNAALIPGYSVDVTYPGVVHATSPDGNINVAMIEAGGGTLTVSPGTSSRRPGHHGGTVAVNGNWYNSPHVFFGWSISDGTVLGYENGDVRHAIIGTDATGAFRMHHTNGQGTPPSYFTHAVTGKLIVANGSRFAYSTTQSGDPTMTSTTSPRTAVGITSDGHFVMVTVDGRGYGPGMTSTQLADFLISIGVTNGVMLDGGGSSAMWVANQGIVNDPSDGSTRAVRNQLIFTTDGNWVN